MNDDIYEMRKRLESYNDSNSKDSAREDDPEFSKLTKVELVKKLNQLKHMLPAPPEKRSNFKEDYFDKIQFLNNHKNKEAFSTNQHNKNNQEIYRLKYIEDTIIDQIR